MKMFNVKVVCTTDDPVDSLEHHLSLKRRVLVSKFCPPGVPTKQWRWKTRRIRAYLEKLSEVSSVTISKFGDLIEALRIRRLLRFGGLQAF